MGAFLTQLAALNEAVKTTFGTEAIIYQQRISGVDSNSPITLTAIPIDPLRLEGLANGNFAVRWVKTVDFIDANGLAFNPIKGDVVTVPNSTLTVGGTYTVIQVQEDIGGGLRLVMERRT